MKPPNMKSSPCEKLMWPVERYTSTRPIATIA